jgi:DNA replication protein DnaC
MEQAGKTLSAVRNSIPKTTSDSIKLKCETCQGTGWEYRQEWGGVRRCQCRAESIRKYRLDNLLATLLKDWPKYKDASLDQKHKNVAQQNAMIAMRENIEGSFYLWGQYSRGKTHLMIAQYKALVEKGVPCVLRCARDLIEELQAVEMSDRPDAERKESEILKLVNTSENGHLFIDDIEKCVLSSNFRGEIIFDLLDTIARRQLKITVTSNIPLFIKDEIKAKDKKKQDLRDRMDKSAVARLFSICKTLEL